MVSESHTMDESLFFNTFYYAPIGICLLKPMGSWFKINPAFCKMVGYTEAELMNMSCLQITHPEDQGILHQYTEKLLSRELNNFELEKRYIHKKGHLIWVLVHVSLVRDADDRPQYLVVQIQDITARKCTEQKLRDREQRYKSLIQNAPVGICAFDLEGNFTEVNPVLTDMLGYSSEELLSTNYLIVILPERIEIAKQRFANSFEEPLNFDQFYLRRKDGSVLDALAISSPIIVNGETKGVYYMIRDYSEQRQTEELLKNREKLSVVGELAAGIAHEIRNPLTSLRGFLQFFQTEEFSDSKKQHYDVMLSEIDRINEIVSELLVLAKPSKESVVYKSAANKLNHVIELLKGEANLHNVLITKDFSDDLPFIKCQSSLKQVFINILKNAIQSMPRGGEVFVQANARGDKLFIQFKDQGCGIPSEQLAKIGQPFYTTKETGTGLGLMVSHRIIQNHRGVMRIESEVGKGTTVEIELPMH